MKRSIAILLVVLALSFVYGQTENVRPRPFGFTPGMTKKQAITAVGADKIKKQNDSTLIFSSAPTPAGGPIEEYMLLFAPNAGLAKAVGIGRTVNNPTDLRDDYGKIAAVLTVKYGKPSENFDFCNGDVYKDHSEFFFLGLNHKDCHLTSVWKLSDSTVIMLDANGASDLNSGWIDVGYEFHPEFEDFAAAKDKASQAAY